MGEATLEQRLAYLERTVAQMQRQLATISTNGNWLDKVSGSISDEEAFLEALQYGREIRNEDRPSDEPGENP